MNRRHHKKDKKHKAANGTVNVPHEAASAEPATRNPEQGNSDIMKNSGFLHRPQEHRAAYWGVAVAAIVACIYYLQLSVMQDSLTAVQRAFVTSIHFVETRMEGQAEHSWKLRITVQNSGATAAVSAITSVAIQSRDKEPDESTFIGNSEKRQKLSIGPKDTQGIGDLVVPENKLFGYDIGDLKNAGFQDVKRATVYLKQYPVFVFGWVAYRDIFRQRHVTEFCYNLERVELTVDRQSLEWELTNCYAHNCTDEDCQDHEQVEGLIPKP